MSFRYHHVIPAKAGIHTFLEQQLGAAPVEMSAAPGSAVAMRLRYGAPGTLTAPPGFYLRMMISDAALYLPDAHIAETAGYWAADGYRDQNPLELQNRIGFATRELPAGGRIAWIGSNITGLHTDSTNWREYMPIFRELLGWLSGGGLVSVEPWPNAADAAVLIHSDIEDQFTNVRTIVELLNRLKVPSTYNLLVNEGVKHPDVMKMLVESGGELGLHGDTHALFKGQSLAVQIERLNAAINGVSNHTERPRGFRPPELAYDLNTLYSVRRLGLQYFLADDRADREYPRFMPDDPQRPHQGGLVFFPKSELDDYDLFYRQRLEDPTTIARMMTADFHRIREVGGLFKLNYHSQFLTRNAFPAVIERVIREIKQTPNTWIATARDISSWIIHKEALTLKSEPFDNGMKIVVINQGKVASADTLSDPPSSQLKVHHPASRSRGTASAAAKTALNIRQIRK